MKTDLESSTNQLIDSIIELAEISYQPSDLETPEAHFKRLRQQLSKQLEDRQKQLERGCQIVVDQMGRVPKMNLEKIGAYKKTGKPLDLQKMLEISDEELALMYRACLDVFQEKRYQDSIDALTFLLSINSNVMSFWIVLGVAYENENRMEEASMTYKAAILCNPIMMKPYVYAARCYLKDNNYDEAIRVFDEAIESFGDDESFVEQKKEATSLREYVKKLKEK